MDFRRTKIICTIGPSVSSYPQILKLMKAGMNVARLNFSHGTHEQHAEVIERLKKARKELDRPLAIMLDTKGPEIRVGKVETPLSVKKGDTITLVKDPKKIGPGILNVDPPHVIDALELKMNVLIDDGYVSTHVLSVNENEAVLKVENEGTISSNKGVNIPYAKLELPAMTQQDIKDITFGCEQDIDIIAASFIRTPEHVLEIKKLLASKKKADILVISKIESALGVKNFDGILQVSDGIMVARGDLGVELPLTHVPKLQKMMIRKSYCAFKPVVTATQMLESMIHNPLPTRAEASDVANAIYDSTSAVMLSGETAVGKYPIEAVRIMREIVEEAESDFNYAELFYKEMTRLKFHDISSSVALATVKTAYSAEASAIFAFTSSGYTAKAMSRFRPEMPILAVTNSEKTYHQMALSWGVVPVLEEVKNLTQGIDVASCFALQNALVKYGDLVVITAGSPFGIAGTTNTMLVDNIGDVLVRGEPRKGRKAHGKIALIEAHQKDTHYFLRGKIVVLSQCDEEYETILTEASGIILQNHPEDVDSEKAAITISRRLEIPLVLRADGALGLLREGQLVTIDPSKGLIFKGYMENDEDVLNRYCKVSNKETPSKNA